MSFGTLTYQLWATGWNFYLPRPFLHANDNGEPYDPAC